MKNITQRSQLTAASAAFLLACGSAWAQTPAQERQENAQRVEAGLSPIYRVSVTERSIKAINYQHRSGATKIDFRGTDLMPKARGEAKVESKQGYVEVEVEFDNLRPANTQSSEYLTYVLWAITPEGRAANLGEILLNGTKSKLNVTTELQVFGLVVTAEPYYSVTRPSDLIVMENRVRADTVGKVEEVDAKYELLQRGQYQRLTNPIALKLDSKVPLELYEARNAVQIARAMGADRFAADTFQKAEKSLAQAEAYQSRKAGRKPVTMTARESVQTAEDARAIAVKRQEEDALAAERTLSLGREINAENGRLTAQRETQDVRVQAASDKARAQAETDRLKRVSEAQAAAAEDTANALRKENAVQASAAQLEVARLKRESDLKLSSVQSEAENAKRTADLRVADAENAARSAEAKLAASNADADNAKRVSDAKLAAAQADASRLAAENAAQRAAGQADTSRIAAENAAQRAVAQLALDEAAKEKLRLENDKAELRAQLFSQLNAVLKTEDTARGLIVNMSDVIFDSGKALLLPGAREKLAKIAGIVSSHPGLKLEVEGHADSVGEESYNQQLSEKRSGSVRDYLVGEGIDSGSVSSTGLGEGKPVASNETAVGRQQNRRVEIVISGMLIDQP